MSETAFNSTRKLQWQVSDPSGSAWVRANAGSGKTHVLTQRVLRLLLGGTDPASILCLTYTKTAAAEMGRRIFDRLAAWAVMPAEDLKQQLLDLQGRPPDRAATNAARTLFARALETPGGLKIQTMHAFCESLLHKFPFEANVPGHFQVLDEQGSDALLKQAREAAFAALGPPGTKLRDALNRLIGKMSDTAMTEALNDVVRKRGLIEEWIIRSAPDDRAGRIEDVFASLRRSLSLEPDDTAETVAARFFASHCFRLVDDCRDTLLAALYANPGARNDKAVGAIAAISESENILEQANAVLDFYLVKNRSKPTETRVTNSVKNSVASFDELFRDDAALCLSLLDEMNCLETAEATEALLTLGYEILRIYRAEKIQHGLLDYDDLIARTLVLLSRSAAAAWVLYKLDSRIDHVLVDEAQDTSPAQWSIIQALTEDFFAGETASQKVRTIFAVGDDKQSIFSFQGAAPQMLADMQLHFVRLADRSGQQMTKQSLFLSFRSTRQVLAAVDAVFDKNDPVTASITADYVPHKEYRQGARGRAIVWPRLVAFSDDPPDDWTQAYDAPTEVEKKLAGSIAGEIGRLLDEEQVLPSGKDVQAGEILILVRKRDAFFFAMNRALRAAGIATAGADRIALSSHIAVLDCLALADVVLLPDDDLQLAACLKSPMLGLDDDDLIALAAGRKGTLWQSLAASPEPAHQAAHRRLAGWRSMADRVTPFHFFSRVLGSDGGRAALRTRLGSEADDVLDAFLSQALAFERLEPPSLQGFAAYIRSQTAELKRESDERAADVRIMTVHGAKGLEADIVFLADSGGQVVNTNRRDPLLKIADPAAPALLLRQKKEKAGRLERNHADREDEAATDEYRRLLYVAMTRARDYLYVCGIKRARPAQGCWYDLVSRALVPENVERDEDGELLQPFIWPDMLADNVEREITADDAQGVDDRQAGHTDMPGPVELPLAAGRPAWLDRPAPPPPHVPEPLRPSRALAEPDLEAEPGLAAGETPGLQLPATGLNNAMQRGQAIHGLLQYLPAVPAGERTVTGSAWLMQRYGSAADVHADWLAEALAVLDHAELKSVFGAGSRAEVPVAGYVETETGRHAVSGQIDRLVIGNGGARIVDFKTDRQIPAGPGLINPAYITQLALYRRLVGEIIGHASIADRANGANGATEATEATGAARPADVRAILVWTAGPAIMPLDDELLNRALAAIGVLPPAAA